MRLKNKVAAITGAAQGIGAAIAARFAREGAKVMLADINADKGEAAAKAIAASGGEARFVACDVGDAAQVQAVIDTAVEAFGGLDVMVCNAAILRAATILDLDEADFDAVMRVNLKGYFLAGQAAARQMVAQDRGGSIIMMSSVQSIITNANLLSYSVAKGGVRQLTSAMALGLADRNIRVNAIGPGSVATDMVMQLLTDDAARRTVMSRTPMGRLGEPDEIASVAVFLASDDASYVTGEQINADGGRLPLNYVVPVKD